MTDIKPATDEDLKCMEDTAMQSPSWANGAILSLIARIRAETAKNSGEVAMDGITDDMLNAGQERLCQIASRTHFDDYEEAEKYKAMRGEDPIFKAVIDYMRDTQALPLEECAKLLSLRLKAVLS